MRRELYTTYKDLSASYLGAPSVPPLGALGPLLRRFLRNRNTFTQQTMREIRDAVDRAAADRHRPLRPDAAHFLLVNFQEMVLLPLADSGSPHDRDELRDAVLHDVQSLLDGAREQRPRGEITGGDVLKATARLWDRLHLNHLRFWGAQDGQQ